jgi:hypothetical protein
MTVRAISWHWFTGWDTGYSTIEVNIAPAWVGAQAFLYGTQGGGTSFVGIQRYRRRLDTGADEDHDFGGDANSWPPVVVDYMSSVTLAISTEDDGQEAGLVARMDYWG